jgi:hypothetical protein
MPYTSCVRIVCTESRLETRVKCWPMLPVLQRTIGLSVVPEGRITRRRVKVSEIVGSDVLTVVTMKSTNSWAVMPCSLVGVHRRFGGTYRLHLQSRGARSRKQAEPASCLAYSLTLKMEIMRSSETSVTSTELHGFTTQEFVIT